MSFLPTYFRKLQVFVSSTYLDLRPERQAAVTAILENGHIPAGMELFAAGNEEQLHVIRRWIDESDIFLLILGNRYGSIEPKSGLSYIELEYEHARNSEKPFFAIVLNDEFINRKIRAGQSVDDLTERSHPEKLKIFRVSVTSRMCKFVEDEKDIRLAVAQSIRDLERRHDFVGWISGRDAAPNSKLVDDLGTAAQLAASLQAKNALLEEENQRLKNEKKQRTEYDGRTFEELVGILSRQKVMLPFDKHPVQSNVLIAAHGFKHRLASGISNHFDANAMDITLYYEVASVLLSYGLATFGKSPGSVAWQRIILSPLGKRFLAEYEVRYPPTPKNASSSQQQTPSSTATSSANPSDTQRVAAPRKLRKHAQS